MGAPRPRCVGLSGRARPEVPPAGFEPAPPAPEAGALSPELRGQGVESSNLPLAPRRTETIGPYAQAMPRVLLVDDDPAILRLLEVNFRMEGFEVEAAAHGEEAVAAARPPPPDVAILDLMLPGMDGREILARLRPMPAHGGDAGRVPDRPRPRRRGAAEAIDEIVRAEALRHRRARRDRAHAGGGRVIEAELQAWLADGLRAAAPGLGLEGELPDARAAGAPAEGARRLRDQRRARARQACRAPAARGRPGARRRARAGAVRREGRARRPGFINIWTTDEWLHDVVRQVASRRRALRARGAHRRARPGRVREREPDGAAARRARAERRAGRRDRAAARRGRAHGRARVLLQRRRRPDGPVRRLGRGALSAAASVATPRCPRTATTATTSPTYAEDILATHGDALADLPAEERFLRMRAEGARRAMDGIRATLARFNVVFDSFLSEASLEDAGEIAEAIERLRAAGLIYEAEGAVWFRSTAYGDDKDRIVVRSNGRHTYFGADSPTWWTSSARVRPPDLRVGRRPPRRRRAGQGGGRRARLRSRSRRAAAVPVGLVPATTASPCR